MYTVQIRLRIGHLCRNNIRCAFGRSEGNSCACTADLPKSPSVFSTACFIAIKTYIIFSTGFDPKFSKFDLARFCSGFSDLNLVLLTATY